MCGPSVPRTSEPQTLREALAAVERASACTLYETLQPLYNLYDRDSSGDSQAGPAPGGRHWSDSLLRARGGLSHGKVQDRGGPGPQRPRRARQELPQRARASHHCRTGESRRALDRLPGRSRSHGHGAAQPSARPSRAGARWSTCAISDTTLDTSTLEQDPCERLTAMPTRNPDRRNSNCRCRRTRTTTGCGTTCSRPMLRVFDKEDEARAKLEELFPVLVRLKKFAGAPKRTRVIAITSTTRTTRTADRCRFRHRVRPVSATAAPTRRVWRG